MALRLVIILFFYTTYLFAQQPPSAPQAEADSLKTPPTVVEDNSILVKDTSRINERYALIRPVYDMDFYAQENIDTTLTDIHLFQHTERQEQVWQQGTNLGQTPYLLSLPKAQRLGFNNEAVNASIYNFTLQNTPFFKNEAPYTLARYIFAGDNEQLFEAHHAQNFSPLIGIALKYQFTGSDGVYKNQATSLNNMGANVWLKTKNDKYNLLFAYINNTHKRQENGGIVDTENLFESSASFRINKDVYLDNAESRNFNSTLFFQQSYDLGAEYDSLDTKDSVYVSWFVPDFRLIHRLKINNQGRQYFDNSPPSDFYQNYFYTNADIEDSVGVRSLSNELLLAWEGSINQKNTGIKATAGVEHIFTRQIWQTADTDSTHLSWQERHNSLLLKAKGFTTEDFFIKNLQLSSEFEFGLLGWHVGNLFWESKAKYQLNKHISLDSKLSISTQKPDLYFHQFHSMNHDWINENLKPTQNNSLLIGASYKKNASLSYTIGQLNNFTYFGYSQEVAQRDINITYQALNINTRFNIWRQFFWRNKIVLQQEPTVQIAIPKLWLHSDIYFDGKLFDNALGLQAGFMLTYMSRFNAAYYSPSLGNFYLQNSVKTNQYPLVDLYANLKIKRATIFLRSYHLLQGLPNMEGMFAFPAYALPDRVFRIGVSWLFYD